MIEQKADVLICSELQHEEMVNSVFGESEERGGGEGKGEGEVKVYWGQEERSRGKQEGRMRGTSRKQK